MGPLLAALENVAAKDADSEFSAFSVKFAKALAPENRRISSVEMAAFQSPAE